MTITDPAPRIVFSARTLSLRLTDSNQDPHLAIEIDPAGPGVQFAGSTTAAVAAPRPPLLRAGREHTGEAPR